MMNQHKEALWSGRWLQYLVQQATEALIALEGNRLEELARDCARISQLDAPEASSAQQIRSAIKEQSLDLGLKIYAAVLEETRANLSILGRLHVAGVNQQQRDVEEPLAGEKSSGAESQVDRGNY